MKHFYNLRPFFSSLKKSAQLTQCLAVLAIIAWPSSKLLAQAPAISYSTPQTYTAYTPMTPLSPSSTGGAVTALSFNASTTTLNTGISDANCVAIGSDGNLYIGESSGQVSVYTPGGGPATVYKSGFGPVTGICVDPSNNVYLADGTYIWEILAGGGTASKVGSFTQATGVAIDAGNNLYITQPGGVTELLSYRYAYTQRSTVASPQGVAVDANGTVYVGDQATQAFYKISTNNAQTQISSTIAPTAITTDPSGNVYIASPAGLYMISAGGTGPILEGSGSSFNATGIAVDASFNLYMANGTITETQPNGGYFIKPALLQGLTFDVTSGQISGTPGVISANNNYTVTAFNASGNSSATLAITINAPLVPSISYYGNPTFVQGTAISPWSPSSTGGVVPAPAFNSTVTTLWSSGDFSLGLAMDKAGNFYIGDYTAKEVLKWAPGGSSPTVFATGFGSVAGVAVDASGNVYLADPGDAKVWKVPAGGGTALALGSFNYPYGVATDAAGNVYVADRQSGVYKMAPDGTGQTSLSSTVSGCVTVDLNGNVFFGDFNGNIDEIPVGGAQKVFNHLGGLLPAITTDASGNVYVVRLNTIYMLPAGGGSPIQVGPAPIGKEPAGLVVDANYNLYWMWEGLHKANPIGGFFTSPELPAGLTMNPTGGTVSGTPITGAPYTNYTVTAFNTTGAGSATLPMTVSPLPPAISYSSPQTYNVGTAITALTPVSTGGAVAAPAYDPRSTLICLRRGEYDSGLAMDQAGNIYIADVSGRVVLELAPGSSTATVFNQDYGTVNGIAVDASGNVYVADAGGSALWEIPAGGAAAKFKLGSYTAPRGVSIDAAGNIYVADYTSGIFKMAADGTGQTNISSTSSTFVSVDLNGNVFFADSSGNIYEIPAGGAQKAIYSAPNSLLALETDASGNVYYTYYQGNGIYMLPAGGSTPAQVSSLVTNSGTHTMGMMFDAAHNLYFTGNGVNKAQAIGGYYASPELPAGITIDPTSGAISGTPAVTSAAANYTITAFNAAAAAMATINIAVNPAAPVISYSTPQNYTTGTAITALMPASSGGAVAALSFSPNTTTLNTGIADANCVAAGSDGKLYIGESSGKVSVFTPGGGPATVLASGFGPVTGICVDKSNNVFLGAGTDIWKIPAGGGTVTGVNVYGQPSGVAVDAGENLYVTEDAGIYQGVVEVSDGGYEVTGLGNLASPLGIAIDANGNIYAGDQATQAFYEISTNNVQTQISSTVVPQAITSDPSGNIYVAAPSGLYMMSAGGAGPFLVGSGTSFNASGIAVDANFNLYLAHGTITETSPAGGYFIKPALLQGLTFDINSGQISGTPNAVSANNNYTVTAFNANGQGSASIDITTSAPMIPVISYSSPQTYMQGTTISTLSPSSTAYAVAAPGFNTATTTLATGFNLPDCLAMDKAGNIYIGDGTDKEVFLLTPGSSTPVVFASGFSAVNGLAVDASGNVYVADVYGPKLWKVPAGGGTAVTLASFTGPTGVALDAVGNIYVADRQTGVFKMAPDGTGQTSISSTPANNISVDLNGNVFFTDNESGNLDEIPAGGAQKVIYAYGNSFQSLTTDASGNVYYMNRYNVIYMLPAGGGAPVQVGPTVSGGDPDGLMVDAGFNLYWTYQSSLFKANAAGGYFASPELPNGLTIDPTSGDISGTPSAASPATNYKVTAFNTAGSGTASVSIAVNPFQPAISYSTPQTYTTGTAITALTPNSTGGAVAAPDFNPATTTVSSNIDFFTGLAMDNAGNIYIGDRTTGQVLLLAPGSSTLTVFAGGFQSIFGIAVDASGNVYVADFIGGKLWKVPSGGGTAAALGSFSEPEGVAIDASGNIYVADRNTGIYKMAPDGSGQTRISSSQSGYIAVDLRGNVFFTYGANVDEIPAGGTQKVFYSGNLPIQSLTIDPSGNIYVMFSVQQGVAMLPSGGGAAIRVVPASGLFTKEAGGLLVDAGYNLYWSNRGLFKANATGGYFVSPQLPAGLNIDPTSGAISGTPALTAASVATDYTVTAFNATGSATATVNITINATLPVISYSTPQTYLVNTAITPLTPANTGGAAGAAGFSGPVTMTTGVSDANCVAFDQAGNMYIGENGQVSELYSGTTAAVPIATGFKQISAIAVDASDNVYVTDGAVWKIPSGGGLTLGLDNWGLAQGIAVDAANNIYVADVVNGVFKIAADGSKKTRIDNTPAAFIASDMNGNLIFSASTGSNVYEIPAGGSRQVTPIDGAAALTADQSGNFYVLDYFGALNIIYPGGSTPVNLPLVFGGGTITGLATDAHFNLYGEGGSITELSPTGGYFVSPELSPGLTISPTSGTISGTPTAGTPAINYNVSAFNAAGGATAVLNIKVVSANASLSNLTASHGALSPAFTSGNTAYTMSFTNNVSAITLTPTTSDPGAAVAVNSVAVASGSASGSIHLAGGGTTTITTTVKSSDGTTTKTYTLTVTRAPSGNANLSSIGASAGPITPALSSGTSYALSVSNATASMTIKPLTSDPNATMKINGTATPSGTVFGPVALTAGVQTVISIAVLAQDGSTTKTYTLTVTRGLSGNANLTSLKTNPGTLVPNFSPAQTSYTESVINAVSTMTITPTATDANATIKVNNTPVTSGTAYGPVTLAEGTQTVISTEVRAKDGTTKIYTVTVTRAPSSNANLVRIGASVPVTPGFSSGNTSYTASVSNATESMIVKPVTSDANAKITVNGTPTTSGTTFGPIALTAGAQTVISIAVMAQDGSTNKTYTLTVTRAAGSVDSYDPGISVTKPTETPALADDGIMVHQGVSPNGDGINDFLQIDNISQYPDNKLMIMNRNGQLVFEARGYDNSSKVFDGHSNKNGQMQLPGTYFYQLDYTVNGISKHKTGFIVLKY